MQLFPFSYSSLWYVTCYVLYYLLHGILNRGVDIPGKQKNILMIITIVYLVMVFLTNRFYSNELICFCAIHILSYCIKNYLAQKNKLNRNTGIVLFAIGLFAWLGGAIVFNAIGVKFPSIGNKFHLWNRFYNPFILILAYGSIIIASSRSFGSDIINKLSSYSLYIYMFTGNQMIRTYLDNAAYDKVSVLMGPSTLVCLLFIIAYSIIKAFAGIFLSSIYKYTFGKIVTFVIKGETYIAKKIVEKV